MDVQPERADPVRSTRHLLEHHPETRVLVLTGLPLGPSLVREVADAGACGLLPKSVSLGVVVETIPALHPQAFSLDRASLLSLCAAAPGAPFRRTGGGASPLTSRELDVLGLLASGVDLQRASARLGISVNTARGYVKNLYRKLGVHSQLEMVAVARGAACSTRPRESLGAPPDRPKPAPPPSPFSPNGTGSACTRQADLAWTGDEDEGVTIRAGECGPAGGDRRARTG